VRTPCINCFDLIVGPRCEGVPIYSVDDCSVFTKSVAFELVRDSKERIRRAPAVLLSYGKRGGYRCANACHARAGGSR
jgi:hypothetical protein